MNLEHFTAITQTHRNPHTTTEKYRFVPTAEALEVLARHGWHPVRVQQARARKPEHEGYQQHAVWLECPLLTERLRVGDRVIPRVLLRNSHQGDASFRLFPALFEKVCSNGLIVSRPGCDYRILLRELPVMSHDHLSAAVAQQFVHLGDADARLQCVRRVGVPVWST